MRVCTNQENSFNKVKPQKNNKLGIKGVHWNEKKKKFVSMIHINGKTINLGHYNVAGDADSAYRFAEAKYYGNFARTTSAPNN